MISMILSMCEEVTVIYLIFLILLMRKEGSLRIFLCFGRKKYKKQSFIIYLNKYNKKLA